MLIFPCSYFAAIPDLFNGDPVLLNRPVGFDVMAWLKNGHTVKDVDPIVETLIKELKSKYGVKKLGGVGYCFGGKYVVRYLKAGQLDAGYVAHPSFVDEEEFKAIEGPLSISAAGTLHFLACHLELVPRTDTNDDERTETDQIFPAEKRRQSEDILMKSDHPWQLTLYSDVEHGFSVRADLSKPRAKWAKEQAFYQAVQWFDEYIKKA